MVQQLQAAVTAGLLTADDAKSGLAYGGEADWFANGPNNTIKLTDLGFAEM